MKKENERDQFVERVLGSLDGLDRAQPQPWFYTRLLSRLKRERRTGWEMVSQFLSRPAVAMATLCLVLLINAFFLFRSSDPVNTVVQADNSPESESILASSSSFDFENITP